MKLKQKVGWAMIAVLFLTLAIGISNDFKEGFVLFGIVAAFVAWIWVATGLIID